MMLRLISLSVQPVPGTLARGAAMAALMAALMAAQYAQAENGLSPAGQPASGEQTDTQHERTVALPGANAGNLVEQLAQRYPGRFTSVAEADTALVEEAAAARWQNQRKVIDLNACLKQFFVTSCTDAIMARDRAERHQLRFVKVQANAFKRQENADERDRNLAASKKKRQNDAAQRLADEQKAGQQHAARVQDAAAGSQKNDVVAREQATRVQEQQQRAADHAKSLQQTRQRDAQRTQDEAANRRQFADKQAQTQGRQQELRQQQADSDAALAKKNADRAQQDKLLPGSAPPLKNADVPQPPAP